MGYVPSAEAVELAIANQKFEIETFGEDEIECAKYQMVACLCGLAEVPEV